jgi:hypothetical protein
MGLGRTLLLIVGAVLCFALIGCSPLGRAVDPEVSENYYFGRFGRTVVHCRTGNWLKLGHAVMDADHATFRPLAPNVGVDRDRVYFREHPQPHISRERFVVDGLVLRDDEHVYVTKSRPPRLVVLEGADPATFRYIFPESVNPRQWARDASRYYLNHEPIDVDVETFRFLNNQFVADGTRIFTREGGLRPVSEVTGPIEVLNAYHLRMGDRILSGGLKGARILDFDAIEELREISPLVLVINGAVYARGEPFPVPGVDPASFEAWPGNQSFARDANAVYFIFHRMVRIEEADRETFAPFEGYGSYARDAHRIFYRDRVLTDADPETFEIARDKGGPYARDRHGRFRMGRRVR